MMNRIRKKGIIVNCLLAGILIVMTLLVYVPAMRGGFIWDDDHYVKTIPRLKSLEGFRRIWLEPGATAQYYPMVFTSFWVQYQFWALKPFYYHLVNVLLHGSNAVLLWLVLQGLHVPGAWMAAAIFALHPVHLESVAWITERKNVLSGFFYLASLLAFMRFFRLGHSSKSASGRLDTDSQPWDAHRGGTACYLLSLSLFACALLSKSVTCSLPAVILLLLWWKHGRVGWRNVVTTAPLFVLGALYAVGTIWFEKHYVGAQGEEWALTFPDRFLIAGRALWFYAGKLFFPYKLTFIYPRWHIDSSLWWQYLFPCAAAAVVVLLWIKRNRWGKGPLVAVLFFCGTLLPALGFIDFYPMRYAFVADHFQYLASIGLIALCVAAASVAFVHTQRYATHAVYALCVVALVLLGMLVWHGGYKYRDLETLWRDTIAKNPQCWMAHSNLGIVLMTRGDLDEAISHYKAALQIAPAYEEAHNNLGMALAAQGKLYEAIEHYFEALRLRPDFQGAHNNLGNALKRQGRIAQAIYHYTEALRLDPYFTQAHNNLGVALASQGKLDQAIIQYKEALRLSPGFADAHHNLGLALAALGHVTEAMGHYSQALRIRPNFAEAHNSLGVALIRQGDFEQGIMHFQKALAIMPEYAQAKANLKSALDGREINNRTMGGEDVQGLNKLAMAYIQKGAYEKALSVFEKMAALCPNDPTVYYNMACLYAKQNRLEDAVTWLKKAVDKGYDNWDLIRTDKDMELVRQSSYYSEIIKGHE